MMGVRCLCVSGLLLAMTMLAVPGMSADVMGRTPQDDGDDSNAILSIHQPSRTYQIPSASSTTSSSSTTGASLLSFSSIQDTTVCGNIYFTLSYYGSTSSNISLFITGSESATEGFLLTEVNALPSSEYTCNWTSIAIQAGEYVLEAVVLDYPYYSNYFNILNGSDTSCLTTVTSSAPSEVSSTSDTISSSSTGSATGVPVVGAVSTSKLAGGGIAGVVIGVLGFVVGLIAISLLIRRYRRSSALGAPRGSFFEKRRPKGAISINSRGGSFSSAHGLPGAESRSEFLPPFNLNNTLPGNRGRAISDQSIHFQGEKPFVYSTAVTPIPSAVHRASHNYRDSVNSFVSGSTGGAASRPSRHSSLMYTTDPFGSHPVTPSPRHSGEYIANQDIQRQIPVALFSRSESSLSHPIGSPGIPRDISATYSQEIGGYDSEISSPTLAYSPVTSHRVPPPAVPSSSGPASSSKPARRTKSASARKPVPAYLPGEALEMEPTSPRSPTSVQAQSGSASTYYLSSSAPSSKHQSGSSIGASSAGNDWSFVAAHSHSTPSGSYRPHSSTTVLPNTLTGHSLSDLPDLNHKSSFGERQMHVLMPDPPPREMQ